MSERKLVGTQEMFAKALAGGYAIGAYNVNNMEILQAIAEAAEAIPHRTCCQGHTKFHAQHACTRRFVAW